MSTHFAAWECAFVLTQDHAHRLTSEQHIQCITTTMRHPDKAPLEVIALACQILGDRV